MGGEASIAETTQKSARPRGTPSPRSAEAIRIPSHGHGRLMPLAKLGQPAINPAGRPRTLRDVQRLARKKSMDALTYLIGVYTRPDGLLDRGADPRVGSVAAAMVMKWAYGEPPPYDPTMERPETRIDLDGMSLAERKRLLEVMDRITTVVSDADADQDDGPDFDASRFAVEPLVIEAQPLAMDAPVKKPRKPRGKKPKPRGRPRKAVALDIPTEPRKRGRPPGKKKRKRAKRAPKAAAAALKPSVSLFDTDF